MNNYHNQCFCGNEFTQRKNLYAHLRKIHQIEPLNLKPEQRFQCNSCDKKFSCQSSLSRHTRIVHSVNNEHDYNSTSEVTRKMRLICPHETCREELLYYNNLRQHLAKVHGVEVQCQNLTFNSIKDFETWKDEIQKKTFSLYTKDTGNKCLKSGVNKIFLNCHRSYCYKSKGKSIRAQKSNGTNKTGTACPSRLEVTIKDNAKEEPLVSVKYWKTHCGHTEEIRRLTLKID